MNYTRMEESVGFEPTEPLGSAVFETAAFDRSANSPCLYICLHVIFCCQGMKRATFDSSLDGRPSLRLYVVFLPYDICSRTPGRLG